MAYHTISKMYKKANPISSKWASFTPVIVLLLLSCTNGETDNVIPFTASEAIASANNNNHANQILPDAKSSVFNCDPSIFRDGKTVVSCKGYTTIPTDNPEHDNVQVLDMSGGNHLQTMTDGDLARANMPMLTTLNLQNCHIHSIQRGTFRGKNILEKLDLSKNRIEVLDPEIFSGLQNLKLLILAENPINRFEPETMFPPLPLLSSLDMSKCQLDSVPENAFKNLRELEKLHLDNNKLARLDWRVFRHTRHLHTLTLADNPWHCDCHVKFLIDTLRDLQLMRTIQQTRCSSSPESTISTTRSWSLGGVKWDSDSLDGSLVCHPEIQKMDYKSSDVLPPSGGGGTNTNHVRDDDDDDGEQDQVKLGQDVHFECQFIGYPRPEVIWLKDNKPIVFTEPSGGDSGSSRALPQSPPSSEVNKNDNSSTLDNPNDSSPLMMAPQPKMQIQDGTFSLVKNMDDDEKKRNYNFKVHFVLRRVELEDKGEYECLVTNNAGGFASKKVFLNLTGESVVGAGVGRKRLAVWMWILMVVLTGLILVLLSLMICFVWRRKEKRKQEGFRKVVHEKFKDSNVDLGELVDMKTTSSPNHPHQKSPTRSDGNTPLLDNASEHSTVLISDSRQQSHLPDVALGNAELLRNSNIFSPKPPPALHGYPTDDRKEFFARQISEPYLRPASAMSLSRPVGMDANQRRYIFSNQHYQTAPIGEMEHQYAIPDNVRTLPRAGSAMSMSALPENDMRRQLFLRQYSQPQQQYQHPAYATALRYHPHRRNPSVSSEPPNDMRVAFSYSTLPRRPVRLQSWSRPVSPTGSTCSSYSTLSWRPSANPITGLISDGVGPRRDAGGGSNLSLSKTPELTGSIVGINGGGLESMNRAMVAPVGGGKVKSVGVGGRNPRLGHTRTPSSLTRGHNDFFSFEPIQEVESSEYASNLNLDSGRQTPTGYTTQSLARGDPRYKKKKPPPISFNPATLKVEPSRAFDHLKGRSVSPAFRNGNYADDKLSNGGGSSSGPTSLEVNKPDDIPNNGNTTIQVPVLESPIDVEEVAPTKEEEDAPPNNKNRLSMKPIPPPPPPKPKRSQNLDDEESNEQTIIDNNLIKNEILGPVSDGTVV